MESLYPSIPIDLAINYVKRFLLHFKDFHNINIEYVLELLSWVLLNNIIKFNNKYYLQILGIAMGTPIAVALANIFLCMMEFDILDNFQNNNIKKPFMLYRFIDDLFGIFYDNISRDHFTYLYNNSVNTIKITHNYNNNEQIFLDLCLYKGQTYQTNNKLDIKLYQKPLNNYLYLPPHSFHTSYMFKGFILSNFNRIRFKCTNDNDFYIIANNFITHLYNRGYQYKFLTNIFKQTLSRDTLINHYSKTYSNINNNKSNNPNKLTPTLIFKTVWNPRYKRFSLNKCIEIPKNLKNDPDIISCLSNRPICCFKRGKNLLDLIGKIYLEP